MLRWNWKQILGSMKFGGEEYYRLYRGNCLAVLGRLEDPTPRNGLDKPDYVVYGEFWNDAEHLRNCLGLNPKFDSDNLYEGCEEASFNSYYMDEDMEAMIKLFAEAHIPVRIFYEEQADEEARI